MNIKKKIINYIFELNTSRMNKKENKNDNNFYEYISEVIENSHFTVKLFYKLIIFKITIIYLILFIFLLNEKNQKMVLKLILKTFEKLFLVKNIFKLLKVYSIMYYYD